MPVQLNTVPQRRMQVAPGQVPETKKITTRLQIVPPAAPRPQRLFAEALLEMSSTRPASQGKRVAFSMAIHSLVILGLIVAPFYFTDAINMKQFAVTMLVAPPPPPPAPQNIVKSVAPKHVFVSSGKLIAPTAIPRKIAMIKEDPIEPDMAMGVAGGVPGGVPGGQLGGVMGGIISGASRANMPVPAAIANKKTPLRVGGKVRAPKPISKPSPKYPALARQTRVQGDVLIDAILDTGGNVVQIQAVSGHPLLIPAALEAVKQWKYEASCLNDEVISVQMIITVSFRLDQGPQ